MRLPAAVLAPLSTAQSLCMRTRGDFVGDMTAITTARVWVIMYYRNAHIAASVWRSTVQLVDMLLTAHHSR